MFDNIDLGGDKIIKGAFAQTLASRYPDHGAGIPVYWNHDTDDPFKNLGLTTSAIEDEHGLKVEGDIDTGTELGKQVAKLLKENRVSQMSFAYNVEAGAWGGRAEKRRRAPSRPATTSCVNLTSSKSPSARSA